jgi:hypothetical protein
MNRNRKTAKVHSSTTPAASLVHSVLPRGGGARVQESARLADLLKRYDVNDYAASVKVFAVKPR